MLEIKSLSLKLDDFVLDNISFQVEQGDYYIVLGESGAGKTILMEAISGLYPCESGDIILNGDIITSTPIHLRSIGIVFQDHLIFPHLNVFGNISYPLRRLGFRKTEIEARIHEIALKLNIEALLNKKKFQLSGGELQRVALARSLVLKPKILLLDEPLASIDVQLKSEIRKILRQLNREGQTIIHVTHDYEEAISLGNKVAIIEKGKMLQSGNIHDVFHHPKSAFVAKLSGINNFFPVNIQLDDHHKAIAYTNNNFPIHFSGSYNASEGFVIIRAEDIVLSSQKPDSSALNCHYGIIVEMADSSLGKELWIDIGIRLIALISEDSTHRLQCDIGRHFWISWKSTAVRFVES